MCFKSELFFYIWEDVIFHCASVCFCLSIYFVLMTRWICPCVLCASGFVCSCWCFSLSLSFFLFVIIFKYMAWKMITIFMDHYNLQPFMSALPISCAANNKLDSTVSTVTTTTKSKQQMCRCCRFFFYSTHFLFLWPYKTIINSYINVSTRLYLPSIHFSALTNWVNARPIFLSLW